MCGPSCSARAASPVSTSGWCCVASTEGGRSRKTGRFQMPRRVVITGMGMVTPIGSGKEAFWDALSHGRGAGGPITHFDPAQYSSKIAAEVIGFDPKAAGLSDEQIARGDRATQFAIAAAYDVLRDSGLDLDKLDRRRLAVCVGTGIGAIGTAYNYYYDVMDMKDEERYWAGVYDPTYYTR